VARVDTRVVSKGKQHAANRREERVGVAAGQIGPADRAGKERIPHEKLRCRPRRRAGTPNREAHAARTMSRRVVRADFVVAESNHFSRRVEAIDRGERLDAEAEQPRLLECTIVEEQVVAMQVNRRAERAFCRGDAGQVIYVRMSEQNVADAQLAPLREREELRHLVTGIDERRFRRPLARNDKAVLEERPDCLDLDYHRAMILAVLDDLLFTSKIRTTAAQLGVPLTFARSSEAAIGEMRRQPTTLVIFDLDNPRTDPLGTIALMRADGQLASIPTLGFVSHVHVERIEAARRAGIGDVVARSAFAANLPAILAGESGDSAPGGAR